MAPWLFLAATIWGAVFTLNAFVSQRSHRLLLVPSFFAGWLTSELPLHHLVWQAAATLIFIGFGALGAWPGWIGLGITALSWMGLWHLWVESTRAREVFAAALQAGLGSEGISSIKADPGHSNESQASRTWPAINPFRFKKPGVRVHRDIAYVPGGGKRNQLDVFVPAKGVQNAPVLLQIHGGGWTIGNKREQAQPLMNHLTQKGWVCVACNYRLSPRATWPDHLVDVKRVIAWIRSEIANYGGDPNFIVATGGSAGGHLTAMVGLSANDPEYQPGFEDIDTSVVAAIPFYGVYDFSDQWKLQAQGDSTDWIAKTVLKVDPSRDHEALRRASPMHRIHAGAPPFLIIHGTNDSLTSVEEARHFAWSLAHTSSQEVVYAELPRTQHAFEIFHSTRTSAAIQAVEHFLTWCVTASKQGREGTKPTMSSQEAPEELSGQNPPPANREEPETNPTPVAER